MIDKFKKQLLKDGLSENTSESYASDIKIFINYYEEKYMEKFTTFEHPDIITYINDMQNMGNSPTTINRKLAALKKYNIFLVENNIQKDVVIRDKDYIKIQESLAGEALPDIKEINKIKHDIYKNSKKNKRDYCVFTLLMYGGFRESEIVSIRLVDVKLKEHVIDIVGKGKKFRQVMINNQMYDALEEYLEERNKLDIESPYLFVGQKTNNSKNKKLNRNFCNRLLDQYKDYCKDTNLHPHLIRAYFCTNALHNVGYTIDQVANQAGHNSLNTTRKYLRIKKEDLLALANKQ